MTVLSGWQNFYVIVGSSTGALIGLQFVVMTLIASRPVVPGQQNARSIFVTPTIAVLVILFGLEGVHGAMQQSLEKSMAAELLSAKVRGSGFGVLATVNGIGDLVSSIAVGVLWSSVSPNAGFLYAGIFTFAGALLIYFFVPRRN